MINFKKRTLAACCTILFLTPGQDNGLRVEVSQLSLMGTTPRKCGYAGSIWSPPRDSPRSPFVYLLHCTSRMRLFADDTLIYSTIAGFQCHAIQNTRISSPISRAIFSVFDPKFWEIFQMASYNQQFRSRLIADGFTFFGGAA